MAGVGLSSALLVQLLLEGLSFFFSGATSLPFFRFDCFFTSLPRLFFLEIDFFETCLSSLLDFFEPSSLSVELALRLRALFVELTFFVLFGI